MRRRKHHAGWNFAISYNFFLKCKCYSNALNSHANCVQLNIMFEKHFFQCQFWASFCDNSWTDSIIYCRGLQTALFLPISSEVLFRKVHFCIDQTGFHRIQAGLKYIIGLGTKCGSMHSLKPIIIRSKFSFLSQLGTKMIGSPYSAVGVGQN